MEVDWDLILRFSMSPAEIVIRGSIIYWFIFALLRLSGRRDIGSLGIADLLLIVLVADAAQNAMAGDYKAVPDGLLLIATLVFWSFAVDRACYFWPGVRRVLQPSKLCLVKDGEMQLRAMRREYITRADLESELRAKGVADLSEVYRAYMEPDGTISAIKRNDVQPGKAAIW